MNKLEEKSQPDDCLELGKALEQTKKGARDIELVINDDGEVEVMTSALAKKSGKIPVGTTIGSKPYFIV